MDLGLNVEATGYITWTDGGSSDGDVSMTLHVDDDCRPLLVFNGRDTHTDSPGGGPGDMMIEVTPCEQWKLRDALATIKDRLAKGDHPYVRVKGRWVYDGVEAHGIHLKTIWAAIVGAPPDLTGGWTEIHPVTDIEFLR